MPQTSQQAISQNTCQDAPAAAPAVRYTVATETLARAESGAASVRYQAFRAITVALDYAAMESRREGTTSKLLTQKEAQSVHKSVIIDY